MKKLYVMMLCISIGAICLTGCKKNSETASVTESAAGETETEMKETEMKETEMKETVMKKTETETQTEKETKQTEPEAPVDVELSTDVQADGEDITGFKSDASEETAEAATEAETDSVSGLNTGDNTAMTLPYEIPDNGIMVKKIGQYTGPFVEDGTDTPTDNVASVVVTNTSNQTIQYADLQFTVNGSDTAEFVITTLLPGSSALVQEKNQRRYEDGDAYAYSQVTDAMLQDSSMMEDKIAITEMDGELTIQNLTSEDLGTVYVYYKYVDSGIFLGGITYRVKFEAVTANATLTEKTSHFKNGGSKILMVDNIPN